MASKVGPKRGHLALACDGALRDGARRAAAARLWGQVETVLARDRRPAYMKKYWAARSGACGTLLTPAQEAKAAVYRELGYRQAGMVGEHLTVARPMVKTKGHIVQVIGPDGKIIKTLYRHKR